MAYIDSFNINKTDYDARHLRNVGINEVTSLSNLPINKRMIHATLSEASTLSIQDGMEVGEGLIVICECTAKFKMQFNSDSKYKFIGDKGINDPILCQNETMFKIYITKSSDSSYVINLSKIYKEMSLLKFTIHISKTISDPAKMITVDGNLDPEVLLSQFRRCLCKKVSDNNVKICYLNDEDSNQYHDGTEAVLTTRGVDVMVYFPEMWYLGTDTDDEWQVNISTMEQEGWKHAPASLVGAYKADYNNSSKLYSISDSSTTYNTSHSFKEYSTYARNRGAGYHLVDYQQHCIMTWMFYARYKNTNATSICGYGHATGSNCKSGSTNDLGIRDTEASQVSISPTPGFYDLPNFLGVEGCWGWYYEFMEGIHIYKGEGLIAYDKGDYCDKPLTSINSDTKRVLKNPTTLGAGTITKIFGGTYADIAPIEFEGSSKLYFCGTGNYQNSSSNSYACLRASGGPIAIYGVIPYSTYQSSITATSRLAFDGNIEVVDDVNTFKSLPVL